MFTLTQLPLYCRIYASENGISIGSDNGLSPIRRQAIIQTNAVLLSIGRIRLRWNFNQNTKLFIQENTTENIFCEMAVILSRGGGGGGGGGRES